MGSLVNRYHDALEAGAVVTVRGEKIRVSKPVRGTNWAGPLSHVSIITAPPHSLAPFTTLKEPSLFLSSRHKVPSPSKAAGHWWTRIARWLALHFSLHFRWAAA